MDIGEIIKNLGIGLSVSGAFLAMAWKADDGISTELRKDVSLWLQGIEPDKVGKSLQRWPTHFAALFDSVFGKKHFSLRCFFRSSLASIVAFVLCTLIFMQVAPEEWENFLKAYDPGLVTLMFLALLVNLIPDYISLLETRFVISRLQIARSLWSQIGWLLVDFVATFCIFVLAAIGLNYGFGYSLSFIEIQEAIDESLRYAVLDQSTEPDGRAAINAIPIWTTFFTSIWIWLYFLAQFFVRLVSPIRNSIRFLQYALPIQDRPLRAVGEVIALIVFLGYMFLVFPMVAVR